MQWSGNTPARHCADRNLHGKKVSPDKRKAFNEAPRKFFNCFGCSWQIWRVHKKKRKFLFFLVCHQYCELKETNHVAWWVDTCNGSNGKPYCSLHEQNCCARNSFAIYNKNLQRWNQHCIVELFGGPKNKDILRQELSWEDGPTKKRSMGSQINTLFVFASICELWKELLCFVLLF